ncbi:helix-turn-helix domain-containing protein [Paraconexibacter algicola]|uniref:Helix-turn-helix domain-containing protein n=1 Tax=Paraconexibacter algicola TaxID=2133960 RepID=A0A2T4UE37_9ACTN|nr:helix-turn-helix domain-containing protein [Paraconexibacter algicola]PTL55778.1 hypothetical protein C7Y72_19305 [Paraconexibacter algicola]
MSQRDDVLRALRDAGPRGVHTFELRAAYIGNPSQRIAELEEIGHTISRTPEALNGKARGTRYRLVSLAGEERTPAGPSEAPSSISAPGMGGPPASRSSPASDPARLFDPPPAPARAGRRGPYDAAA